LTVPAVAFATLAPRLFDPFLEEAPLQTVRLDRSAFNQVFVQRPWRNHRRGRASSPRFPHEVRGIQAQIFDTSLHTGLVPPGPQAQPREHLTKGSEACTATVNSSSVQLRSPSPAEVRKVKAQRLCSASDRLIVAAEGCHAREEQDLVHTPACSYGVRKLAIGVLPPSGTIPGKRSQCL